MKKRFITVMLILVGMVCINGVACSKVNEPKLEGVDSFSGVVKSIETIESNIFLVVNGDKEERVYYSGTDKDVSKIVLNLKVGDSVDIQYALGTPEKYKETSAMPLSKVTVK